MASTQVNVRGVGLGTVCYHIRGRGSVLSASPTLAKLESPLLARSVHLSAARKHLT